MRYSRTIFQSLAIAVVMCILGGSFYQQWQRTQAARPDYDIEPAPQRNTAPEIQQSDRAQVERVSDGDTLRLTNGDRIRLCGIDAPELKQPLGEESKALLRQLTERQTVIVIPVERDRHGRLVAEVLVGSGDGGEKSIQEELLKAGLAYVYPRYVDDCPNGGPMRSAEAIAREQRRGVWRGNHQRPWDYRRQQRAN